ncbi:hypothetical protein OZI60_25890, partial [Escherichia coli]|uniref:hypothetical protein n=1 Tax=Escherichia coli TaxID=562 RepID=UPI0022835A02
ALTFQNHTNRPLTDFGGKTSIFSHPVYLFLREFSLQDSRGGSLGMILMFTDSLKLMMFQQHFSRGEDLIVCQNP